MLPLHLNDVERPDEDVYLIDKIDFLIERKERQIERFLILNIPITC